MISTPQQILEAYKAAVYAKDVDAFVSLYDPEVRVFDMWEQWSYEGLEAWRGMVNDWFGSLGTEQVEVDFLEVETVQTDDLAVIYSLVRYKGLSAEGKELRAMQNRITSAARKKDGGWKIFHQHSSAPAAFETGKVMLK